MCRVWGFLLMGMLVLSCGDGKSPTAPGDELVGTWELVSSSDVDTQVMIEDGKVTVTFKGDGTWVGSLPGPGSEFQQIADEHWNPLDYLDWRTSTRASRYSSITHALPCSSFVAEGGALPGSLKDCSGRETQQFYELIGKYNQFIAGWDDVVRTDSNSPVQPTDIDSVESFSSQRRLEYEDMRGIQGRTVSGTWSVVGSRLVMTVASGKETENWKYDYSVRNNTLTLIEEEGATVERYEKKP